MKRILTYIAAGLLAIGAQSIMAQSVTSTNSTPGQGHRQATPEQRQRMQALLKALDLKPADLKGLSHEERQAKIKSAAETVDTQLKAKEANGTLTPEEKKQLAMITHFLNHPHKAKGDGASDNATPEASAPPVTPPQAPPSAPPAQ